MPLEGKTTFQDAVYGEITVENRILEDAILLKSDGYPTYHLAAQVDDHLMEISHVLRGEEWLPSAPMHILIHRALGWEPPIYAHLPVMMGPDKKKFGKRNGALGALEYPKQGYLREATAELPGDAGLVAQRRARPVHRARSWSKSSTWTAS